MRKMLILMSIVFGLIFTNAVQAKIVLTKQNPATGYSDLVVINDDGTNMVPIVESNSWSTYPEWSPDGKKIVYIEEESSFRSIYIANADGSNQTHVKSGLFWASQVAWSMDGEFLYFSTGSEIHKIRTDGTEETIVLGSGTFAGLSDIRIGEISPDGSKLLFSGWFGGCASSEIFVCGADGQNPQRLTYNGAGEYFPLWSQNGSKIIWSYEVGCMPSKIFIMNSDGSNQHEIYYVSSSYWPSPLTAIGDNRILYRESYNFWSMDENGNNRVQVTSGMHVGYADWIADSPPNQPPAFHLVGDQFTQEGVQLNFTVSATDPDEGDVLAYSAEGLPSEAIFNPDTRLFTWTPEFDQEGNYEVSFTVTDSGEPMELDMMTVKITVGNVNRPPVLAPISNQIVDEGQQLEFIVNASDPDGDNVHLEAQNLPNGADFADAVFSWIPGYLAAGNYTVIFTAEDDGQPVEQSELGVVITVGNISNPEELTNELIDDIVNVQDFPKEVVNSYLANLKKVNKLIQKGQISPSVNQLLAFMCKVEEDLVDEMINQEIADQYLLLSSEIISDLGGDAADRICQ